MFFMQLEETETVIMQTIKGENIIIRIPKMFFHFFYRSSFFTMFNKQTILSNTHQKLDSCMKKM